MELDENTLKISREELKAFCLHASADISREHLASVSIDLRSGMVAATDGHRLLAWVDEKRGGRQILLPAHGLRSLLAIREPKKPRPLGPRRRNGISPPKKPEFFLRFGEKETRVDLPGISVLLRHVDAAFPPVEQVIPTYKMGSPCSCVAVNPQMFADVAKLAKLINFRIPSVIVQAGPTALDPLLLRFAGDAKWLAVLMPMREDGTYDAVPRKGKAA